MVNYNTLSKVLQIVTITTHLVRISIYINRYNGVIEQARLEFHRKNFPDLYVTAIMHAMHTKLFEQNLFVSTPW